MSTPTDSSDLDEIRQVLGRALHEEVKTDLKQEAARPARLRTKAYTLAAGALVAAAVASLWFLWPADKKAAQTEPAKQKPGGSEPTATPEPMSSLVPPFSRTTPSPDRRELFERGVKQVLDLAEEGWSARTKFRDEAKALLADDRGRKITSSEDLVARYRVVTEDPLLSGEADATLDAVDAVPSVEHEIEQRRQRANRAVLLYRRASLSLQAVVNAAAGQSPAAETLGVAVEKARERDALAELTVRVQREKAAREAAAKKAADEAAKKAERDAEEKRWGNFRPGTLWKGKLTLEDGAVDCDIRINTRAGDKLEGVIGWAYKDRRDEINFTGEVDAGRVKWKTTRILRGNPWPGVTYEAAVDGETMTGTWRQRDGHTYPFRATLEPAK